MLFQRFGSASSVDVDAVVFVESIDENVFAGTELCHEFNLRIAEKMATDKKVNVNLAVLKNGLVVQVLKGTSDETNNAMYSTYALHEQFFPNQISALVARDIDLKILRTSRVLLSLLSKTEYRTAVKLALKEDVHHQISTLKKCSIQYLTADTLGKKDSSEAVFTDFKKTYAFQLGQTLGLVDGVELYTKESIAECYPALEKFLQRDAGADMSVLEDWKQRFVEMVDAYPLKTFVEYKIPKA